MADPAGGDAKQAKDSESQGLLEEGASKESTADNAADNELEAHGVVFERKIAVWQVTIRLPLDYHPLNIIALSYGFLPFLVPGYMVVDLVVSSITHHRDHFYPVHVFNIYALLICVFCFLLNEFILKPILKQPRPKKTANKYPDGTIKPGMPSGHVYNASALMFWLLCEVIGSWVDGSWTHTPHSWVTADQVDKFMKWLFGILVLMGPVPWARVYNYDHTVNQCLVSTGLGLATGILAWLVRRQTLGGWCEPWSREDWSLCPEPSSMSSNAELSGANLGANVYGLRGKDAHGQQVFAIFGDAFRMVLG